MRVRTVLAGILAGWICLMALWFQYFRIEPYTFVPDWPFAALAASLPGWTSTAILIFCGLTLFTFGWVAARWNWANNWRRSLQSGAGMGLLAGCLIFDFVGAFWFGIQGHAEILSNFYNPLPEADGIAILIQALFQTGTLLYINFLRIVFVCALLGGLGGIASVVVDRRDFWGKDPRNPEGWLFRLPAYLLTLSGLINILVTVAVLTVLLQRMQNTVRTFAATYNAPLNVGSAPEIFQLFSNLDVWLAAFIPLGLTWGWIFRTWVLRKRLQVLSGLWLVLSTLGFLAVVWYVAPGLLSDPLTLILLALSFFIGAFIGFLTEERSEGFSYHLSDWVGFALSYGILAATQFIAGIISYGLVVSLISITNIPHLTAQGVVDKTPVEQVFQLYTLQSTIAFVAILIAMAIGLALAGFASFMRTVLGTQEVPPLEA